MWSDLSHTLRLQLVQGPPESNEQGLKPVLEMPHRTIIESLHWASRAPKVGALPHRQLRLSPTLLSLLSLAQ